MFDKLERPINLYIGTNTSTDNTVQKKNIGAVFNRLRTSKFDLINDFLGQQASYHFETLGMFKYASIRFFQLLTYV